MKNHDQSKFRRIQKETNLEDVNGMPHERLALKRPHGVFPPCRIFRSDEASCLLLFNYQNSTVADSRDWSQLKRILSKKFLSIEKFSL